MGVLAEAWLFATPRCYPEQSPMSTMDNRQLIPNSASSNLCTDHWKVVAYTYEFLQP
jgi:hypothetical protein